MEIVSRWNKMNLMNFSLYIQIMSLYTYLSKINLNNMRSYELRRYHETKCAWSEIFWRSYAACLEIHDNLLHQTIFQLVYSDQYAYNLSTCINVYQYPQHLLGLVPEIAKKSYFENWQYFSNFSTIFHLKIKRNMCSYYGP